MAVDDPENIVLGGSVRSDEIVDLRVDTGELIADDDASIDIRMSGNHHACDVQHLLRFRGRSVSDRENDLEARLEVVLSERRGKVGVEIAIETAKRTQDRDARHRLCVLIVMLLLSAHERVEAARIFGLVGKNGGRARW